MAPEQEHHSIWNDRLQDWLDGEVDPAAAAELQTHLATCAICQGRMSELQHLDQALRTAAPPLHLDEAFDARLFAQIDAVDESQRAAARRRIEQEFQDGMRALARGWRRKLGLVLPSMIAGIAIAFALTGWFDESGLARSLVMQFGARAASDMLPMIQIGVTAVIGAGLGAIVARWLLSVAD